MGFERMFRPIAEPGDAARPLPIRPVSPRLGARRDCGSAAAAFAPRTILVWLCGVAVALVPCGDSRAATDLRPLSLDEAIRIALEQSPDLATAERWQKVLNALNSGEMPPADERQPPSAARYADLLDGWLAALGVVRPVLVGNSIGGAAAIRYAASHPDRVAALVLENPGGLAPTDDAVARAALAAMVRFFAAGARGAWWFRRAFAAYYRLAVLTGAAAAPQRQRVVASAAEIAPLLYAAWRGFASADADLRPLAPRITCPVLFAWATGDRFVQLRRSLPAIRQVPGARLERFACGHAPHLERSAAFEAAVARFLAEVAAAGSERTAAARA